MKRPEDWTNVVIFPGSSQNSCSSILDILAAVLQSGNTSWHDLKKWINEKGYWNLSVWKKSVKPFLRIWNSSKPFWESLSKNGKTIFSGVAEPPKLPAAPSRRLNKPLNSWSTTGLICFSDCVHQMGKNNINWNKVSGQKLLLTKRGLKPLSPNSQSHTLMIPKTFGEIFCELERRKIIIPLEI